RMHRLLGQYLSSTSLPPAPPPSETYSLSLHDALPISATDRRPLLRAPAQTLCCSGALLSRGLLSAWCLPRHQRGVDVLQDDLAGDRKSTRLNSSHVSISYAVFC